MYTDSDWTECKMKILDATTKKYSVKTKFVEGHKYFELTMRRTPSQLPPEVGNNTQCVHYQLDCTVGPVFDGGTVCAVNINRH